MFALWPAVSAGVSSSGREAMTSPYDERRDEKTVKSGKQTRVDSAALKTKRVSSGEGP
jgi:hypothetical protein